MTAASINIEIEKEFLDTLKRLNFSKAGKEMAAEILRLTWERTAKGQDINGRTWRRYKAEGYAKRKRRKGRGKNDWLIYTGALKRGLKVKYKGTSFSKSKITMRFVYDIPADQKKKLEGLLSTTGHDSNRKTYPKSSYEFIGLSKQGANKNKELLRLTNILKKKLDASQK